MKKGILVDDGGTDIDDGGTDINLLYSLYCTLGMGIFVSFSFQVLVVLILSGWHAVQTLTSQSSGTTQNAAITNQKKRNI